MTDKEIQDFYDSVINPTDDEFNLHLTDFSETLNDLNGHCDNL